MGTVIVGDAGNLILEMDGVVMDSISGIVYTPDFSRRDWGRIAEALVTAGFNPEAWQGQVYGETTRTGSLGRLLHWRNASQLALRGPDPNGNLYEGFHNTELVFAGYGPTILVAEIQAALKLKRERGGESG
jgi:hypothetical protein